MAIAGKVTFVAGGCGVVGSGIVRAILHEGATVVVSSRSASRLDDLHTSIQANQKRQLTTIQEGCDTEESVQRIKDFIMKEFGKIDHVVLSIGSIWQNGILTEQSLEEFQSQIHNGAGMHFLVSKVFLPYLSQIEVRNACLYGIIEAARAQFKDSKVSINELRINLFVQPAADSTFRSNSKMVGTDKMGKVCASIIKRQTSTFLRVGSREEMEKLLQV